MVRCPAPFTVRMFHPAALALAIPLLCPAVSAATAQGVLPPASAVKGWKQVGRPRVYTPRTLYDLIDGEAESVTRYAFASAAHGEYAPAKSTQPALTVDVFDMSDPMNAFGLFASSDRTGGTRVPLGAEGVRIGNSGLNFWKGRYVVRTTLVGSGAVTPANRSAQMGFAKAAAARITGTSAPPAMLRALPPGYTARSERYVRANVAGHAFLQNAVTARYPKAGSSAELFIAQYPSAAQAKSALQSYRRYEATGASLKALTGVGDEGFSVRDKYAKEVAVARKGRALVGVIRARDAQSALSLLRQTLPRVKG